MTTQIDFARQIKFMRKTVEDNNYKASTDDVYIGFSKLTASRVVTLPDHVEYMPARPLMIADESGKCDSILSIVVKNKNGNPVALLRRPNAYTTVVATPKGWVLPSIFGDIISAEDLPFSLTEKLSIRDIVAGLAVDTLTAVEALNHELSEKGLGSNGTEIPLSDSNPTSLSSTITGLAVDTLSALDALLALVPVPISGNSGFIEIPAGSTRFFSTGVVGANAPDVYAPIGKKARLKDLRIVTPSAPGQGNFWNFILQKLFSDTALMCTIGGSEINTGADLSNFVEFQPEDRWSIKVVSSPNAPVIRNIGFSFTIAPSG